jgi:hypothetical protein
MGPSPTALLAGHSRARCSGVDRRDNLRDAQGQGTRDGPGLSVRAMVAAVQELGRQLTKSQVHRDYKEGAPSVSPRQYLAWRADHRDLSRSADGRIDRAQASAPNTSPGRGDDLPQGPVPATGEQASPVATPEEPDDSDPNAAAYRQDRARNERIKADRAELELQQLRGELVLVREVEALQFTAGRITRDRVLMVPARAAADLHALLLTLIPEPQRAELDAKVPLHALERRLDDLLRTALSEAAKAIEDARRDDDEEDAE